MASLRLAENLAQVFRGSHGKESFEIHLRIDLLECMKILLVDSSSINKYGENL